MCAFLLSAPDFIEWGHLTPLSSGPPDTILGPHSITGAKDIPSISPANLIVHRTGTTPIPSTDISAASHKSPSSMAAIVPARVSSSLASFVPGPSAIFKTSSAAISPFCGFCSIFAIV